jgi:hypothetical protein
LASKKLEERRRLRRAPPVKVLANMPIRRWRCGNKAVGLRVGRCHITIPDQSRKYYIASLTEDSSLLIRDDRRPAHLPTLALVMNLLA